MRDTSAAPALNEDESSPSSPVDGGVFEYPEHSTAFYFWQFIITVTPYCSLICLSPANEQLLRATVESCLAWWIVMICMNAYCVHGFLAYGHDFAQDETMHLPLAIVISFHAACLLNFFGLMALMAPMMAWRADAPSFRQALRIGLQPFYAKHGRCLGMLLRTPFTMLPTSTFAYHLSVAGFFREPPATLYAHLWRLIRLMQASFAAIFLVYYAAVCAVNSKIIGGFTWVLLSALYNLGLTAMSKPNRRRRLRAELFPHQAQEPRAERREV